MTRNELIQAIEELKNDPQTRNPFHAKAVKLAELEMLENNSEDNELTAEEKAKEKAKALHKAFLEKECNKGLYPSVPGWN